MHSKAYHEFLRLLNVLNDLFDSERIAIKESNVDFFSLILDQKQDLINALEQINRQELSKEEMSFILEKLQLILKKENSKNLTDKVEELEAAIESNRSIQRQLRDFSKAYLIKYNSSNISFKA